VSLCLRGSSSAKVVSLAEDADDVRPRDDERLLRLEVAHEHRLHDCEAFVSNARFAANDVRASDAIIVLASARR